MAVVSRSRVLTVMHRRSWEVDISVTGAVAGVPVVSR